MEELAVNGNKHGVNGDQIRKAALKKSWHERMQQFFWMMEKVQIGDQMNVDCRKESQMYFINI